MKIVSACLVGIPWNYKGESKLNQKIYEEFLKGELLAVCPEVLSGQPIPSPPAEIKYGTGLDVLDGKAKVINPDGSDITAEFLKGALAVLEIANDIGAKEAILKSKSPSCGCGKIYDGSFTDKLIPGDGVTAALLKINGIKVYTEDDFK